MRKVFIVYFPAVLVACQVIVNGLYFLWPEMYYGSAFYLNHFFGVNMMIGIFFVVFTWGFKFCYVSRWAAVAELLFGFNYMIVQQDNLYNILFQITVGLIALSMTFWYYIKRFPLCRLSLIVSFLQRVIRRRSCEKGIENWKQYIMKHYDYNRH